MIDYLKRKWREMVYWFRTQTATTKQIRTKEEQYSDDMVKKLDHDRQMKEGENDELRAEIENLKNSIQTDRKKTHAQVLQERRQQLTQKNMQGAVSMAQLTQYLEENEVILTDAKREEQVAVWEDIRFANGRLYLLADFPEEGELDIAIGGKNQSQIFQNPKSLLQDLKAERVPINLTPEGKYMPSIMSEEIPNAIYTKEQGILNTSYKTQDKIKELAEKEEELHNLKRQNAALEGTVKQLLDVIDEQERKMDVEQLKNAATEEGLEQKLDYAHSAMDKFNQQGMEIMAKNHESKLWEEVLKRMIDGERDVKEELLDEMEKEEIDKAIEEVEAILQNFNNIADSKQSQPSQAQGQQQQASQQGGGQNIQ